MKLYELFETPQRTTPNVSASEMGEASSPNAYDQVSILVVEDDDVDAAAIERGLQRARVANPIIRVKDGNEALAAMRGEVETELREPFLVLLDLHLPTMSGAECLQEMRKDARLLDTIVFVLTTSNSLEERIAAYDANVAGYIVKSKAGRDFIELMTMLDCYMNVVQMPIKA